MSIVLLSNVGLRDVLLRGQRIEPARSAGERILAEFDSVAPELTLPMLTPVVDFVLRNHHKVEVVLFGTDQPESTPERHRATDTRYLAEVAARLLRRRPGGELGRILWKPIPANPSRYDDMLSFFRDQLSPRTQRWVAETEVCYVYSVGGTPGANAGLLLAAIERFGDRCVNLYLLEGQTSIVRMDLGGQLERSAARRLARDRLEDRSFAATASLLHKGGAPTWLVRVAEYAADRYQFDFESAAAKLGRAILDCAEDWANRERCRKLSRGLDELTAAFAPEALARDERHRLQHALMAEVHHNAALAYKRGEYAAFLGRVFRFQEALLAHMVEEMYPDLPAPALEGDDGKFREYVRRRVGLEEYLGRQRVEGNPLSYNKVDRPVMQALVRYGWDGGEELMGASRRQQFQAAYESLKRLDCLVKLRNKSIIAHGFEGTSETRLLESYREGGNTTTPLHDMAGSLEALGIDPGVSPFDEAARLLLEALERL